MSKTIYEAVGGMPAVLALARAWHARCMADPVVSHAFSHGMHPQHSERLAAYWAQALGGPAEYTGSIADESFVIRLHSGNGEHREMDERAQRCFAMAIEDAGIAEDEALRSTLLAFFSWATQRTSAYPESADDVPSGLPFPQWSWEGPMAGAH
jgi:hemoglobin